MEIFNGKREAHEILLDLKKKIVKENLRPKLSIILVGKDKPSRIYVALKKKAGKKIGIQVKVFRFKESVKEKNVIGQIVSLNEDESVHGILIQLPLPKKFNTDKIINRIDPRKDVDGFHGENRKLLKRGIPYFYPVLPLALFYTLERAAKKLKKKKITAIVNSILFGETLKYFFQRRELKICYFLRDKIDIKILKNSDVIISVCGLPGLINSTMIKKKAILIDAGITYGRGKRVIGDADMKSVKNKASFLTPSVGGIGPLTVAFLLRNVYLGAKIKK